jgi:integrase/recombinase XerD
LADSREAVQRQSEGGERHAEAGSQNPIIMPVMLGNVKVSIVPQTPGTVAPETSPGSPSRLESLVLTGPLSGLPPEQTAFVIAARFLTGYAGHTRAAYRRDLEHYFAWCGDHDAPVIGASRSTVDAYARGLSETPQGRNHRPLSPATVARRLATLSGFYDYAVSEEVITRSPLAHVRRPRVGQDSPTLGLDRDEARRVLTAARQRGPRAEALITLLIYGGLRISEALGADVADLATVRGHRVLTVTRKGGARRQVVLNAAVLAALAAYLGDRSEGPLFSTRSGGRFDRAEAWRMVRRVATDAGVAEAAHVSPHSLRHTFVTLSREAGVALEDVQDAVGHADPRTTRRYDRGRHNLDRSPAHALGSFLSAPGARDDREVPQP